MTQELSKRYDASLIEDKWYRFWQELKIGYDQFNETKVPPVISVCKGHYQSRPAGKYSSGNAALRKRCLQAAQL